MNEKRIKVSYAVNENVKLENGEWLEFSDRLRIQGVVASKGDTAIVRDFNGKKVIVDILKKQTAKEVSEEELEKQKRQFARLSGGY